MSLIAPRMVHFYKNAEQTHPTELVSVVIGPPHYVAQERSAEAPIHRDKLGGVLLATLSSSFADFSLYILIASHHHNVVEC